jgi:hypothetical protein
MKLFTMIALLSISSMVVAGYDYMVQNGDIFGALTLDEHQSVLMTGGGGFPLP